MEFYWLIRNVFIPILGPFALSFAVILLWFRFKNRRKLSYLLAHGRIKILTGSRGLFYFSVITLVQAQHLYSSTSFAQAKVLLSLQYGGIIGGLIFCALGFAVFTIATWEDYEKSQEKDKGRIKAIPKTGIVILAYSIGIFSAFIGYLTYLFSIGKLPL